MIAALLLAAVVAPGFQDTAALDRAVAAFTGHAAGDEGGARTAVDGRLRLKTCPMVAMAWRSDAHDTVVVTCSGPDWRLFVPVVRAVPLAPVRTAAPAVATVARPDPVIRRGDPIVIEAANDGFSITREGVALADAAPGARFMVRVDDAKGPVQAVAQADGRATLPGWAP